MYVFYALPWALGGGGLGYLVDRSKRKPSNPVAPEAPGGALAQSPRLAQAPTTAVQRLGHVLGWTGNIIAAPLVCLGAFGFTQPGGDAFAKGSLVVFGITAFLIGRALRYFFAGSAR